MLDQKKIIDGINTACKVFFTESIFFLKPSRANRFSVEGDIMSKAINNYNNSSYEVNVLKWFSDFWIYVDIRFEDKNTFISLSIFQGLADDAFKHQLFRAEWDDYNKIDESHPQPHWHITSNQVIEKTFMELANMDKNSDTFIGLLAEEKSKIIDLTKMHFAMSGNWINNQTHVHNLNDENQIIKWFIGLFSHMKQQLLYVS
ncbi:hypothetical protein ASE92_11935 [Pedobacter sp. Leaf41]|uniref:hypothetical protein n=1 Tax=Pedobacter sp. Leaf41 TaxID=1736218 RepID=UPI000703C160|nr:hypothetical protein [Pedobacter sp. Leaf41]KQN34314.1 hypothetical protein ASE92_11935 [Pedobacter sp. Leaf41]